jgi:SAM-dependent methyltransferase
VSRCYDRRVHFTVDFEQLPPAIREWFLALPEELGATRLFRANELLNAYVDRLLCEHLDALGVAPAAVARPELVTWLLRKVERAGFVELDPWGRVARRRAPEESAAAVAAIALAESPDLAPSLALFDAARAGFVDVVTGKKSGADVLLTPAAVPLWKAYFDNANFGYAANNRVAARLCADAVAARRGLRVVELGGGLGSAAEALLARLAPQIGRYVFTELSPFFLSGAKRKLAAAFPTVPFEFRPLDVNRPFDEQGATAASADVVLAVNVLHVARDVGRTLAEARRLLAPGGTLVMVECVRPAPGVPIYVDYPFQLLDEFWRIDDAGPLRPHGGFLTLRDWRGLLERAGLELRALLPDHETIEKWYSGYHLVGLAAAAPR